MKRAFAILLLTLGLAAIARGGATIGGSGGSGGSGVTSVAMTVPSILSVSGSPITTSGTLAVTLATQNANIIFAGPASGSAATPTFRALVALDLPSGTVTAAATLTSTAIVTGAGGSATQTPSATTTLDSGGNFSTSGTATVSNTYTKSSALTYNGTSMTVDFSGDGVKTVTVTSGNCTFVASNQTTNLLKPILLIVDNSGNGSATNFTLPSWSFFGTAAPTSLAAGKKGVFVLNSTGTSAGSVLAEYSATP